MNTASSLLRKGLAFHQAQVRALTVTIDGQAYTASASGERGERDLLSGGWLQQTNLSFAVADNAFTAAGKTEPAKGNSVSIVIDGGTARTFQIASISRGPGTLVFICESPHK